MIGEYNMRQLSSLFSLIIKYIFLLIISIVLVINVFETATVSYDIAEQLAITLIIIGYYFVVNPKS